MAKTEKEPAINFSLITPAQWISLSILALGILIGSWQSLLPLLAERHYRDGFNALAMKRNDIGVSELEKTVDNAPVETQYLMELSKAYETYALEKTTLEDKLYYLNKSKETAFTTEKLDVLNPWFKNRIASVYTTLAEQDPAHQLTYIKEAENYHKLAAETDAQNPLFQLNLGYFLNRLGKTNEAELYYKKSIAMDNGLAAAHFNLAEIYIQRKQYELALNEYQIIYKQNTSYGEVLFGMINIYLLKQDYPNALHYMEEAYKQYPDKLQLLQNLVALYQRFNQTEKAIPIYETLFKRFPKEMPVYQASYVQALLKTNQQEKAKRFMTLYQEMFSKVPKAK